MQEGGASDVALTPDGLKSDLAARLASIDHRAPDATLKVWRTFLAHLAMALDGDEQHRCDMESVASGPHRKTMQPTRDP